jgi:dihydroorotate dehydrogenase
VSLYRLIRPFAFALDAERAHFATIAALKRAPRRRRPSFPASLRSNVAGLEFPSPVGLAAGFDKDGHVPEQMLGLGFGFVELGTVTPRPQAGNPRPRLFRLPEDGAVINRMGFNNEGQAAAVERLRDRNRSCGIVGVNIGANKDSADRVGDYVLGVRRFADVASYLTVNISSPNTPGLRGMQERQALGELLTRVMAARDEAAAGARRVPVFLKIAPDLTEAELADIAAEVLEKKLEGVSVSNTTLSRANLRGSEEAGGLSGRPLFERSTAMLARMRKLLGPDVALIGVGGVDSTEAAIEKIRAGADLVQLYTGMIFGGPALPGRIVSGLAEFCERQKIARIADLRDSGVDRWADKPIG